VSARAGRFPNIFAFAAVLVVLALAAGGGRAEEGQQLVEANFAGYHSYVSFTRLVFGTGGMRPDGFKINFDQAAKKVILYPEKGLLGLTFAPIGQLDDLVHDVELVEDDSGRRGIVVKLDPAIRTIKASYLSMPYRIVLDFYRSAKAGDAGFLPVDRPVRTIALDPGHGGREKGSGSGKLTEKDIALDISLRLRKTLSMKGYRVVMTRDKDVDAAPDDRAGAANNARADLFISIHASGSFSGKGTGAMLYTLAEGELDGGRSKWPLKWEEQAAPYLPDSIRLAGGIIKALGSPYGQGASLRSAGLVGFDGLAMPAVLVEVGDLDDPDQAALLMDDAFRDKLTAGIAAGVDDYAKGRGR